MAQDTSTHLVLAHNVIPNMTFAISTYKSARVKQIVSGSFNGSDFFSEKVDKRQEVKGHLTFFSLALSFWVGLELVTKPKILIPELLISRFRHHSPVLKFCADFRYRGN